MSTFKNKIASLKKSLHYIYFMQQLFYLSNEHKLGFSVTMYSKTSNELKNLFDRFGTDKDSVAFEKFNRHHENFISYSTSPHTYSDFYEELFSKNKNEKINLFECGLGSTDATFPSNMGSKYNSGASLRAWKEYFPNGNIYGADVDPKTLIQEERITTYKMDQTDSKSVKAVFDDINKEFDFIIDDGLHTFNAGVSLFENIFYKYLKKTPWAAYVIEDILISEYSDWLNYFENKSLKVSYITLPNRDGRFHQNNLILIKHITNITEENKSQI
jgi:hypothetical protein